MSTARSLSNPTSRPATTKLATRRFTSHSQAPGSVSSKSLRPNTTLRSGVAKSPKFMRWQSPQACTSSPVVGTAARSAAMTAAEPRRKVNGLTAMRPNRIGISSSSRPTFEATSTSIGSGRSAATDQSPCTPREMTSRRLRPTSTCSCSFVSLGLFRTLVIRTASGCSGARPVARGARRRSCARAGPPSPAQTARTGSGRAGA